VGDRIETTIRESIVLSLAKEGLPGVAGEVTLDRAPLGEKPSLGITETYDLTATVTHIDYDQRLVTLMGPGGNSRQLLVSPHVEGLDRVKVGDFVHARMTQAIAIRVQEVAGD
jgi:hypothetical protein